MVNILIVSQYYHPEPVQLPPDIASGLRARGHHVQVLTGFPNYPNGIVFPGVRQRWRLREVVDGIDILRVPLFADHSHRAWARALNYLTFALSSATAWSASRQSDVIYIYATQMTPALGPWLWRIAGGAPYVLHVQDLWPDTLIESSLARGRRTSGVLEKGVASWLNKVYQLASAVIVIAPSMKRILANRGVPQERVHLVYNWAHAVMAENKKVDSNHFTTEVIYAGNLGEMQDLETAVLAAAEVSDCNFNLTLIGDGLMKPHLMKLARQLGITNVKFEESIPQNRMAYVYAKAHFGLVSLKNRKVFSATVPSKFQAILAHGLPVITSVQGDVRSITEKYGLGFTADSESVEDLARAFRQAAASSPEERGQMAAQAKLTARQLFSFDSALDSIETILLSAANEGRAK
jgi:glycosyltransferase involved in cell wall biosynthesis